MKPVVFVVACVVALVPANAWAADELGLSRDGIAFSSSLPTPLYDPTFIWTPGDSETASFWVRNRSSDRATLDVAILGSAVDSLMQTGDLAVRVETADGSGSTTTTTGRQSLIASRTVAPGLTERIDVTVALDPASNNQSQVKAVDLRFEVRLTQDDASGGGDQDDESDGDDNDEYRDRNGILPGAGGPAGWLLPAGLLGLATGWLTVAASRRRQERADV